MPEIRSKRHELTIFLIVFNLGAPLKSAAQDKGELRTGRMKMAVAKSEKTSEDGSPRNE